MKKLISISVILVLLASAVFAADVSVGVHGKATLASGSTKEVVDGFDSNDKPIYVTDRIGSGYEISRIRIGASGQLEDGTIGGWLRYDAAHWSGNPQFYGFAWWKPSDLIKLQIGSNGGDGEFGLDGIARWGFYQQASDAGVVSENWAFGSAFFSGWDAPGLILNITPVDALAINIGIPLVNTNGQSGVDAKDYQAAVSKYEADLEKWTTDHEAWVAAGSHPSTEPKPPKYPELNKFGGNYLYQNLLNSTIQFKYNIDGVGTVGLTYIGNQGTEENLNDNGKVIAYFGLSSIENVGIDIGIGYQFPDSVEREVLSKKYTSSVNNPLAVGLGVSFNSGSFGIKARVLGEFGGSTSNERAKDDGKETVTLADDLVVVADVLPYFVINDRMTFYLSAGISGKTGNEYETIEDGKSVIKKDESAEFAWHVNPYIVITPSYWSGAFFAGIKLQSPTDYFFNGEKGDTRNRILNWSIPIGIIIGF